MNTAIIAGNMGYQINHTHASLPTLTGSEKQVTWAEDIRASRIREINKLINALASKKGIGYSVKDEGDTRMDGHAEAFTQELVATGLAGKLNALFGRLDAKFWIDSRNSLIQTLIAG